MTLLNIRSIHRAAIAVVTIGALALVAGCAPDVPLQKENNATQTTTSLPEASYRQWRQQGEQVLQVDAQQSLVVFEVRRAGTFARFGHDHVVASHDLRGFVAPKRNQADLLVQLDQLVIDEAPLRAEAGFTTQPSADDIAGTRRNMLNKVLETDRYPTALMHIVRKGDAMLSVTITLHGQTRTFDVPAKIESTQDGMTASGTMSFNQTDFGIVPFSILNGAIQVRDQLDMRFHLVAKTWRE